MSSLSTVLCYSGFGMFFFLVRLSQQLVFDATQNHTTLDDL